MSTPPSTPSSATPLSSIIASRVQQSISGLGASIRTPLRNMSTTGVSTTTTTGQASATTGQTSGIAFPSSITTIPSSNVGGSGVSQGTTGGGFTAPSASTSGGGGNAPSASGGGGGGGNGPPGGGGGGGGPPGPGGGAPPGGGGPPAAPATAPFVIRPPCPKIGGLVHTSEHVWTPFVGGRPNVAWTSAVNVLTTAENVNHYRSSAVAERRKAATARIAPLSFKISQTTDVGALCREVLESMDDHGTDTIGFVEHPDANQGMINVVEYPFLYTTETIKPVLERLSPLYDEYNLEQSRELIKKIRESMTPQLRLHIDQKIRFQQRKKDGLYFVEYFLAVISTLEPVTLEKYDRITEELKNLNISQFDRENVSLLTAKFRRGANILQSNGKYEHKLTKVLIVACAEAGIGNRDYSDEVQRLKLKMRKALQHTDHKNDAETDQYMRDNSLTFVDVCNEIELCYQHALSENAWPAAKNPVDSKKPPASFMQEKTFKASINKDAQFKKAVLNVLQSTMSNKSGSAGRSPSAEFPCHKCGSPNHWAPQCTQKGDIKGRHNEGKKNDNQAHKSSPKSDSNFASPGPGEPQTRAINGVDYYWCAKCNRGKGRWRTTHRTEAKDGIPGHQGKVHTPPQSGGGAYNFSGDYGAWCLPIDDSPVVPTPFSIVLFLRSILFLVAFLSLGYHSEEIFSGLTAAWFSTMLPILQSATQFAHIASQFLSQQLLSAFAAISIGISMFLALPIQCFVAPTFWMLLGFGINDLAYRRRPSHTIPVRTPYRNPRRLRRSTRSRKSIRRGRIAQWHRGQWHRGVARSCVHGPKVFSTHAPFPHTRSTVQRRRRRAAFLRRKASQRTYADTSARYTTARQPHTVDPTAGNSTNPWVGSPSGRFASQRQHHRTGPTWARNCPLYKSEPPTEPPRCYNWRSPQNSDSVAEQVDFDRIFPWLSKALHQRLHR